MNRQPSTINHHPATIRHRPAIRRRAGFTLIEVLVATAVLAIGIAAGVQALGAMAQASEAAASRATAVRLAAHRLALLEAAVDVTAQQGTLTDDGGATVDLSDADGQDAVDPRFHWKQHVVASTTQPGLLEATVTVTWSAGAGEHSYEVMTYLPDLNTLLQNTTTPTGAE